MRRILAVLGLLLLVPAAAQAWWNPDWAFRKKLTLNTSDAGAATRENVAQAVIPLRLHTGNFVFADAKEDGSDLRVVAGDDKTPLKHHIETWDPANEIAIVWVQVPRVTGASGAEFLWLYFGNKKATRAEDTKGTYDATHLLVLHLAEKQGSPSDATAYAQNVKESNAALGTAGLLGGAAGFDASNRIVIAASPALKIAAGGALTFSAWVKPAQTQSAVIYTQQDGNRSLVIGLDKSVPYARVTGPGLTAEARAKAEAVSGAWHHLAVALGGGKLTLYANGAEAGSANAATPELAGDAVIGSAGAGGTGYKGEVDEVQLANVARSPDWVKLAAAGQGQESKLVAYGEDEQTGGAGHSYFGILVDNLTVDAWVVIVILMAMLVASFFIMFFKAVVLVRTERANQAFIEKFESLTADLTGLDSPEPTANGVPNGVPAEQKQRTEFVHSTLFHVYHLGVRELRSRIAAYRQKGLPESLTPQAVNAIRASLDAGIVRENARLNSQMVLLTIAISGGPFLGLLGTVVGVMITFAAIAAQGDVNVNAIAPGIAAALLATVAGLAVAIPCLFGYNWLASRIKGISAEMQVFADELLTKFAETYSA